MSIVFSIIIPHKNIPNLLLRCLKSIPEREDTEIIIVDDNSDADKVDFSRFPGYDRPNVKIIFDKSGKGAGAARNIGLKEAEGEWILFADSDDTYTVSLNKFLDKYKKSEAEIIYFKSNVIDFNSKRQKTALMNSFIDAFINNKGSLEDIKYGAWEPWNKLIKKSVIDKHNIRFDEISSSNDKMFCLNLGTHCKNVLVCADVIYNYILREGSIIHSGKEKRFNNSWNTIVRQNRLYHEVKYKRKVFIPYFLLVNYKYINKQVLRDYLIYLKDTGANPFEGFFCNFINRIFKRVFK